MSPNSSETFLVCARPRKSVAIFRKPFLCLTLGALALAASFLLDGPVDAALQAPGPALRSLARALTILGEWWSVGAVACVISAVFFFGGRIRIAREIFFATAAGLATGFVATLLRFLIGRARPNAAVAQGFYGPWHDGHWILGQYQFSSFPSGHAATLVGLSAAAWILNRRAGFWTALFAALVSWSRLAQSSHHFSDIIASVLLGLGLGPLFLQCFRAAILGSPAVVTPGLATPAAGIVASPALPLRDELERSGAWLFRYRSYLPLVTIPFFIVSLSSFSYLHQRHDMNEIWQLFCLAISFLGLALRILTVGRAPLGTSGRNTREQVADTLNTTGVYSLVRHPLYLGNFLVMLGFALWPHQTWVAVLMSCIYMIYYERIMLAEEAFLRHRFGAAFEDWARQTPAFIPKLKGWKPSPVPFCWRTVGQREYNAFFLIVTVFFLFDFVGDSVAEGNLHLEYGWFSAFLAAFVISTVLRTIKKRTRFLHVAGR